MCSDGDLRHPLGLAFDATTGLLYIAEWGAHRIAVMDPATDTVLRTIGSGQGESQGQEGCEDGQLSLNHPNALALDGCGNLLVADYNNSKVVVFAVNSGTQIASFPTPSKPRSLYVDASGKLVVGGDDFICAW